MPRPVVVIGAGNAALCAAISARQQGAEVLVLEAAPIELRGGNTFYAGGRVRLPHDGFADLQALLPDLLPGDLTDSERESIEVPPYSADQFHEVWARTTGHRRDAELSATVVERARETVAWMVGLGPVKLVLASNRLIRSGEKLVMTGDEPVRWSGGGAGLSEGLFRAAENEGVEIRYGTRGMGLVQDNAGAVSGIEVLTPTGAREHIPCRAVVMGCGGFEANPAWRAAYLGHGWDLAKVRGTEFNVGDGHRMAMAVGARPAGQWGGCHAVAWELNAPTRRDHSFAHGYERHSYWLGIVVNSQGKRFIDEGADFYNYTYAKYGREILAQPDSKAYQIFDQKVEPLLRDSYRMRQATKIQAPTLDGLAHKAGIAVEPFMEMVEDFNASISDTAFDQTILDGKSTSGSVFPPKSNWAQTIDSPDYLAFPVTCGITFTFGGIAVNPQAQVISVGGRPISGLFAAGEIVGGLFFGNYPAGTGLLAGAVMGRLAGVGAAGA